MTKDSSAKYYHKRKIATKKGTRKISKPVQRRKRTKSGNMDVNDIKISLKMKHKGWLNTEKLIS